VAAFCFAAGLQFFELVFVLERAGDSGQRCGDEALQPDDSMPLVPPFRCVIRRPFIKEGTHSTPVESQPESVLLRKFGNLPFSILIV